MRLLSAGRVASVALGACLTVGLGATASAAPAHDAKARHGHAKHHHHSSGTSGRHGHAKRHHEAAGGTILSGRGKPGRRRGSIGDFYLNTKRHVLFGPKTKRGWGKPVPLIGARGPLGPGGPQGPAGPQGPVGPQGAAATPTFGAARVTTIPSPTVVNGASDFPVGVTVGSAQLPAGVSLVALHLEAGSQTGPPGTVVQCSVSSGSQLTIPAVVPFGQTSGVSIGWVFEPQATTAPVQCTLIVPPPSSGTATASTDVGGSQIVAYPVNLPAA